MLRPSGIGRSSHVSTAFTLLLATPYHQLGVSPPGLAAILTTLSPLAPAWLSTVLLPLAMLVFAAGVLAVIWLPGFLQPRWLRNASPWQDSER